jgi:hypothetical protein
MTTVARHTIRRPSGGVSHLRLAFARLPLAITLLLGTAGLGAAGCGNGDDTSSPPVTAVKDAGAEGGGDATATMPPHDAGAPDVEVPESGGGEAGVAKAMFSSTPIDFGPISCSASGTATFTVTSTGTAPLAVAASTTGTAFTVSPTTLTRVPGGPAGTLTITAAVPGSAAAGVPLTGSLDLFTNDPAQSNVAIPLTATPSGATIALSSIAPPSVSFPSTEVGQAGPTSSAVLYNTGSIPAMVSIGAPSLPQFSLSGWPDGGAETVNPGDSVSVYFGFTPASTTAVSATASVSVTGATCGTNIASISLVGQGAVGKITGYPTAPIDFGFADCGGSRPAPVQFTLKNTGTIAAHVTEASLTGAPGFGTSATPGQVIAANGGTLLIACTGPMVPASSPLTPVSGTLTLQTDADTSPQTITLTEEPHGAVLSFDTSGTPGFGSFGQVVLLQAVSQSFNVKNTGTSAATVTLSTGAAGSGPAPFTVSDPSFAISAGGTQSDEVTFSPTGPSNTGSITMSATGTLCAPLPSPLPLSGASIGGGPAVSPTSLAFAASCGGAAPASQTFTMSNKGSANLVWSMSSVTGPGSGQYTVTASPPPGTLMPGQSSTVTVAAARIASPAPNLSPSAYAAQLTITTDVPFDNPHVVTLGETPIGDQLSYSVSTLRFGQFPINTSTIAQTFTVTNSANPGSPAANLALSLSGPGELAYSLAPTTVANLAPGGGVSGALNVMFRPTTAVSYPAIVSLATSDSLCSVAPSPIQLTGTGTQGKVSVSATTLAFGTDTNDASGLVNCGATGPAHTFTVSNVGNQQFNITGLTLGLGAASPYAVSGVTLPAALPIGGSATITVTPSAIPSAVANPGDASPFTDALTVTTDAALDTPHRVTLVMQARGAVIANTPLSTTWNFGTLANGEIGTFSNTVTNTGNAAASVAFQGLTHPTIFGLQNAPVTVAAGGVTDIVGQFSPPAVNQQWTDTGTLVVTPTQVFCEPLPASWSSPQISLIGSSISGSLPVTLSGNLAFPSTNCGSAAPAAQSITLTNTTSTPYLFTAQLNSGAFYTLQNPTMGDAGAGIIPGNGVVVIGVTPVTVTPGPGVAAGSAAYADDLVISIQSQPPSGITLPISWTLNGAILSLPQGQGPNRDAMGNAFYAADTGSGFELPMANAGTGSAAVSFGVQPAGAFSFSPAAPITVQPGITALPRLISAGSDATCPALTPGSVTFLYSGPVCQAFPVSSVSIQSCAGAF